MTEINMPCFSVVMPVYNSERYVGEALEKKKAKKLKEETWPSADSVLP